MLKDIYNHYMRILEYRLSMPFICKIGEQCKDLYHPLLQ